MSSYRFHSQWLATVDHIREQLFLLVDHHPADALFLNSAISPLTRALTAGSLAAYPPGQHAALVACLRECRAVLSSLTITPNTPRFVLLASIISELDALIEACAPGSPVRLSRAHLAVVPPPED